MQRRPGTARRLPQELPAVALADALCGSKAFQKDILGRLSSRPGVEDLGATEMEDRVGVLQIIPVCARE